MKGKLKSLVVPGMYALSLLFFMLSFYFVQKFLSNTVLKDNDLPEDVLYVDDEIIDENNYMPVVDVVESIVRPYISGDVAISKNYYDYKGEESNQQQSIIYYENTYIQNSGVDYSSNTVFEVVSILGGTVIDVKSDNIMGTIVEIRHTNELISVYQCLGEVMVKVDDVVVQGQVIGKSGKSNLNLGSDNNLHFELYYMGEVVNPEEYYNKSLNDL